MLSETSAAEKVIISSDTYFVQSGIINCCVPRGTIPINIGFLERVIEDCELLNRVEVKQLLNKVTVYRLFIL
jgi:hypothetical protein